MSLLINPLRKVFFFFFFKAIDHTFYGIIGVLAHEGCWENEKSLLIARLTARDLKTFRVFSQNPQVGYYPNKPINVYSIALNFAYEKKKYLQ